jgi:FkbM family methyltransferase
MKRTKIRLYLERFLDFFGYQVIIHKKISLIGDYAGSKFDRRYLERIVRNLDTWMRLSPRTLVEIGANLGQDSAYLSTVWQISPQGVYCLEPTKSFAEIISNTYGFNSFDVAAFNVNGDTEFYSGYIDESSIANAGSSSLLKSESNNRYKKIHVKTIRMETWMQDNNVDEIDFLKIDAEGVSYEILEGFGSMIEKVKVIQIETERVRSWKN